MSKLLQFLIRIGVLLALVATSAVVLAQDEGASAVADTGYPFIGIRYWDTADGLLVTGVIPNTPAEAIGLQSGDVVQSFDAEVVRLANIRDLLANYAPGDTMMLLYERDGDFTEVPITLMALPDDLFNNADYAMPLDTAAIGLYLHQCGQHVYVVGAPAGSAIAESGLQKYDRLVSVNGAPVDSIGAADVPVSLLNEGDIVTLGILRRDREMTIKVMVEDERKRRHPRQRPRPRPRLDVNSVYETAAIGLGYGESAILIQKLSPEHELYAVGLRPNDLITAANGMPVADMHQLFSDDAITLAVTRDGAEFQFGVPSSAAPLLMFGWTNPQDASSSQSLNLREKQVTLGVRYFQLEPDSPYLADYEVRNGALVAEVIEGLPAAEAGLQVGDIIIAVEGQATTLEIDLRNRIYAHEPGETITLDILRDGGLLHVEVTLRAAG